MIGPQQVADGFALNLNIIKRQTDGLSHEDSVLQPPFNSNCLNWVLGHILVGRDRVLKLLDQEPVLSDEQRQRYEDGSPPVTKLEDAALTLAEQLDKLETGQQRISQGLQGASGEKLAKELMIGEHKTTVGERIFGLYFHDTYHTGQTDLLRQLAGTNDKVL